MKEDYKIAVDCFTGEKNRIPVDEIKHGFLNECWYHGQIIGHQGAFDYTWGDEHFMNDLEKALYDKFHVHLVEDDYEKEDTYWIYNDDETEFDAIPANQEITDFINEWVKEKENIVECDYYDDYDFNHGYTSWIFSAKEPEQVTHDLFDTDEEEDADVASRRISNENSMCNQNFYNQTKN